MGEQNNIRAEVDTSLAFQAIESAGMGMWQLNLAEQRVLMSDRLYDLMGIAKDSDVFS